MNMKKDTFRCGNATLSAEQAARAEERNKKIWNDFWKIPRKDRTPEDWKKLMDVQILVKE